MRMLQVAQSSEATTSAGQHYGDSSSPGQSPGSPMQFSPSLDESQISRLATSAKELVQRLPQYQPKAQTAKRKTNKELEVRIWFKTNISSAQICFWRNNIWYLCFCFSVCHEHAGRRPEANRVHQKVFGHLRTVRLQEETRKTFNAAWGKYRPYHNFKGWWARVLLKRRAVVEIFL